MSLVVFPFKSEDADVATANLETAAHHPRVTGVLAVGAEPGRLFELLAGESSRISTSTKVPVEVILQDRIGDRRSGKGDGMNTAMRRFLTGDNERLHFYDADITNFDASWIEGAEKAADDGFPVVRHYFPRASTDAMITWMLTRPLFAIGHSRSQLWQIPQPLGGEVLLSRGVVEKLVDDDFVTSRSDWGIDTVITYATAGTGPMYEHFVPGGKQHALYGSLEELRAMVYECFEAALAVGEMPPPSPFEHEVEPEAPATPAIAHKVGYDVESTIRLLTEGWTATEAEAARTFPRHIAGPILANQREPTFAFLDGEGWYETLVHLIDAYRPEPAWRSLVFRLWVARVLAYTTTDALAGHSRAMEVLEQTVVDYASRR
ncbi:MAG TPA: hypothetical protein VHL52_02620 [Acidimicrobiia bacterium]|nr:hypothetical protein [Acidimicrobiia bacterium]